MNVTPVSKTTVLGSDALHTVLTFRLERQVYAIPIAPIAQLIEMVAIIPLPQMHTGIEGIINVRGKMTPVVSLRHYVGLEKRPWTLHTPIILMRLPGDRMVGLIVDELLEVIALRDVPAPPRPSSRQDCELPKWCSASPIRTAARSWCSITKPCSPQHRRRPSPTADLNEYYTLLVEQADGGQGMSPEHLSRLFEPFFTTKEMGAGMGLSVSYDLIKQYDGDITVTSQPGQGSTFTVWLHTTEGH